MPTNNGGSDDPTPPPNPWGLPPNQGGRDGAGKRDEPRQQGPRNPWGNGGNGGRPGSTPPDLDEVIARGQAWLRGVIPGGLGGGGGGGGRGGGGRGRLSLPTGGRGLAFIGIGVVAVWLASGFYRVQPDEQGVVLRFGAFDRTTLPGLNYHLPWPVEAVELPPVTRINRVEIGYQSGQSGSDQGQDAPPRDVSQESLMLTGDENIIDINFAVFWRIRDAGAYLFATRNPDFTVRAVSESVMREVIGRTPIQPALTDARAQIEASVRSGVQAVLDNYNSGIDVTQVQLQKVDPPADVIESFRDVQRANTDADRARNEAEATRNDIVPRARGEAAAITAAADGQRQAAVAESTGAANRFLSVLKAYDAAKDVTLTRLYIETMQDVLSHNSLTVIDDQLKGVVPYLPLAPTAGVPVPALAAAKGAAK